jgi:hypothetical protein
VRAPITLLMVGTVIVARRAQLLSVSLPFLRACPDDQKVGRYRHL